MGLPEFGMFVVEYREQGDQIVERWWLNETIHRIGKPAVTISDRDTRNELEHIYIQNYERHREVGPALIKFDPVSGAVMLEEYYQHDVLHRDNGPARVVYWHNGQIAEEVYYERGIRASNPGAAEPDSP